MSASKRPPSIAKVVRKLATERGKSSIFVVEVAGARMQWCSVLNKGTESRAETLQALVFALEDALAVNKLKLAEEQARNRKRSKR